MSPTERSLALLRAAGYHAEVVERTMGPVKKDLFGFGDILAIKRGEVLLVQTTTGANLAARLHKIAESPLVGIVREAGILIQAHGWRKLKGRWEPRVVDCS